ncbi:hypothetical protein DPM19_26430 [Actinomadura craniellae]|uniref:DUF742 domain-containing protein n=1 Tax=Actinomadura craniellae TaxID=2231787 RepID=A0A365GZJ0_9ACTN|nr:DUF742 domain-containing protein [Actinomadura craniellae]RAY12255.1 hypothetical protein DPM19_26430 [Actinomadura craniellae]
MSGSPWVRPYVLTAGRTRAKRHLFVHTLVSVGRYDPVYAAKLLPEARRLYERAHAAVESVAELSAHCEVPLGVTRVLLGDLIATDRVLIVSETESPFDRGLLERVIDGLHQLA